MLSRLSLGVRSQGWMLVCRATTRSVSKSSSQCAARQCSTSALQVEVDADTTKVEKKFDGLNTTKVADPVITVVEAIPPYSVRKIAKRLDRFTKLSADHARGHKYHFERSRDAILLHIEADLGEHAEALLPLVMDVDMLVKMRWPADLEGWHPRDVVRMSPEELSHALVHHPKTAEREIELKPSKVETRSRVAKDVDAGVYHIRWDLLAEEGPAYTVDEGELHPEEAKEAIALQPEAPQRHVVYVSGLPFDFTEAKVRTAFARCGQIRTVEILNDVRLPPEEQDTSDLPSVDQMPMDRQMNILQEILLDERGKPQGPPSGAEGAGNDAANDTLQQASSLTLDDQLQAKSEADDSITPTEDLVPVIPYLARFAAAPPPRPKQALVEFADAAGEAAALSPILRTLGIAVGPYANKVCYPETPSNKQTLVLGWDMEFLSGHDAATEVKAMLRPYLGQVHVERMRGGRYSSVYCFLKFKSHEEAATAKQALVEHCTNHAVYSQLRVGWALKNPPIKKK